MAILVAIVGLILAALALFAVVAKVVEVIGVSVLVAAAKLLEIVALFVLIATGIALAGVCFISLVVGVIGFALLSHLFGETALIIGISGVMGLVTAIALTKAVVNRVKAFLGRLGSRRETPGAPTRQLPAEISAMQCESVR